MVLYIDNECQYVLCVYVHLVFIAACSSVKHIMCDTTAVTLLA